MLRRIVNRSLHLWSSPSGRILTWLFSDCCWSTKSERCLKSSATTTRGLIPAYFLLMKCPSWSASCLLFYFAVLILGCVWAIKPASITCFYKHSDMSPEDRGARVKCDGSLVSARNKMSIKEADFLTLWPAKIFAVRMFTACTRRVDWCNVLQKVDVWAAAVWIISDQSPAGRRAQTTPELIHLCSVWPDVCKILSIPMWMVAK